MKPTLTVAAGANGSVTFTVKRSEQGRGPVHGQRLQRHRRHLLVLGLRPSPVTSCTSTSPSPTRRWPAKITTTKVTVTRPAGTAVTVPNALHGAAAQGLLAAPYRGWTYFGYNGAGTRGTQPIVETDLNQTFTSSSTYDPRTAKAYPFLPYPEEKAWRGADDSAWVKASAR